MECFKLTKSTIKWFEPIISEEMKYRLKNDKSVFAIGAVIDSKACGVLMFEIDRHRAEIIYIAVSDMERRKGVGTGMLNYLCQYAYKANTMVGCTFSAEDKTDPLYLFFEAQHTFTTTQDEGFVCRTTVDELKDIAVIKKKDNSAIEQFFSFPIQEQRKFFSLMSSNGYLLSPKSHFIKPLCLCTVEKGEISAAVFFERHDQDDLLLSFAYCAKDKSDKLINLLLTASERIASKMSGDKNIYIAAVTPQSAAIVDKLLRSYTVTERFFRSDWDMGE